MIDGAFRRESPDLRVASSETTSQRSDEGSVGSEHSEQEEFGVSSQSPLKCVAEVLTVVLSGTPICNSHESSECEVSVKTRSSAVRYQRRECNRLAPQPNCRRRFFISIRILQHSLHAGAYKELILEMRPGAGCSFQCPVFAQQQYARRVRRATYSNLRRYRSGIAKNSFLH